MVTNFLAMSGILNSDILAKEAENAAKSATDESSASEIMKCIAVIGIGELGGKLLESLKPRIPSITQSTVQKLEISFWSVQEGKEPDWAAMEKHIADKEPIVLLLADTDDAAFASAAEHLKKAAKGLCAIGAFLGSGREKETMSALVDRLLDLTDKTLENSFPGLSLEDVTGWLVYGLGCIQKGDIIELDSSDIASMMYKSGRGIETLRMGFSRVPWAGTDSVLQATDEALAMLDRAGGLSDPQCGIILMVGGEEEALSIFDINEALTKVQEHYPEEVNIIFGAYTHPEHQAEIILFVSSPAEDMGEDEKELMALGN